MPSAKVTAARLLAKRSHQNQVYGPFSYMHHLDRVAAAVESYGEFTVIVAYLHDILEDTHITEAQLTEQFGPRVALAVSLVTDEPGETRAERKKRTHEKLSVISTAIDPTPLIVKAADRCVNLQFCLEMGSASANKQAMYLAEHRDFRDAVYRESLCPEIRRRIEFFIGEIQALHE